MQNRHKQSSIPIPADTRYLRERFHPRVVARPCARTEVTYTGAGRSRLAC